MNTTDFRRLQNQLQKKLKTEKLQPVPIKPDTKARIIENWGSVVKAAEAVGMNFSVLYAWLKQGWVPSSKSLTVVYLLEHTKEEN